MTRFRPAPTFAIVPYFAEPPRRVSFAPLLAFFGYVCLQLSILDHVVLANVFANA
jgi:hypothetical protein